MLIGRAETGWKLCGSYDESAQKPHTVLSIAFVGMFGVHLSGYCYLHHSSTLLLSKKVFNQIQAFLRVIMPLITSLPYNYIGYIDL